MTVSVELIQSEREVVSHSKADLCDQRAINVSDFYLSFLGYVCAFITQDLGY